MLEEVRITGLGVIDDAVLELSPGFNVVTGETGAGKTMVVSGLGLLFGGRADPARVRPGADRANVEGRLRVRPGRPGGPAGQRGRRRPRRRRRRADPQPLGLGRGPVPRLRRRPVGPGVAAHLPGRRPGRRARAGRSAAAAPAGPAARGAGPVRRPGSWPRCWPATSGPTSGTGRSAGELAELTSQAREREREADDLRRGLAEIEQAEPADGEDVELLAEEERLSQRRRAARSGDHRARGPARRPVQRALRGGGRGHPARRRAPGAGGGGPARPAAGRAGGQGLRGGLPGLRRRRRAGLLRPVGGGRPGPAGRRAGAPGDADPPDPALRRPGRAAGGTGAAGGPWTRARPRARRAARTPAAGRRGRASPARRTPRPAALAAVLAWAKQAGGPARRAGRRRRPDRRPGRGGGRPRRAGRRSWPASSPRPGRRRRSGSPPTSPPSWPRWRCRTPGSRWRSRR